MDSTGQIVTQYVYTPFGQPTVTGNNNTNPFQFAGMEHDSTALYHTWARSSLHFFGAFCQDQ